MKVRTESKTGPSQTQSCDVQHSATIRLRDRAVLSAAQMLTTLCGVADVRSSFALRCPSRDHLEN